MKIHREGFATLTVIFSVLVFINFVLFYFISESVTVRVIGIILSFFVLSFFVQFFRLPKRVSNPDASELVCPADGEVVVIEQTTEDEYFKDNRIQVSIFMSPFNVHVNWYPAGGKIKYVKYHPGKFLVAWHPKSSLLNERTTVVLETNEGKEILIRQIAGAVARRIVTYSKKDENVNLNQELGFIKFGSRVDIFLPPGAKVKVNLKDNVKGNKTILAQL
jgi:phosphatidylserine decarboxylase